MSDKNKEQLKKLQSYLPTLLLVLVAAYFIGSNWDKAQYIIITLFGFGAIVFIHELGHFLVARFCDIEVETFAIGFAIGTPFLFGVKRVENGYRVRLLPKTSGEKKDPEGDCLHIFTIPAKCKAGETEYCIGPMPLGGFVKMLGQDDSGPVEESEDPRSFANKTVSQRMAVIAAGVTFNVIGAFLIFAVLALIGFNKMPAKVGGVLSGLPAQQAGLEYGDEIVEINGTNMEVDGKNNLDFSHIMRATIFSDKDKPTSMTVQKSDGSEIQVQMTPVKYPGARFPIFGIDPMETMQVIPAKILDEEYTKLLGISGGEKVTAIGGIGINNSDEYKKAIATLSKNFTKEYVHTTEAIDPKTGEVVAGDFSVPSFVSAIYTPQGAGFKDSLDAAAFTLVPRLKVGSYSNPTAPKGFAALINKIACKFGKKTPEPKIKSGDIIVKIGRVEFPSFTEFRAQVQEYANQNIKIALLRKNAEGIEERIEVEVPTFQDKPKKDGKVTLAKVGVALEAEMDSTIVARILEGDLPRGATILTIDNEPVSDFYQIAQKIESFKGQRVPVVYYAGERKNAGSIALDIPESPQAVTLATSMKYPVPFTRYQREYKADGIFSASKLSVYLIGDTLGQSIETLKKLLSKPFAQKDESSIGTKDLSGPIGIVTMSYNLIKGEGITKFIYFMGMISCFLAVMNLLPIPVVDGGHLVLLIIEKIKGSPVSMLAQQILTYTGLALLGTLFIWVTYNDILRALGF